jgi:subtilase family serine protease
MSIKLLTATAIQSGTVNIISLNNVSQNDKVVVRFKVANEGTNSTGNWQITALLPTLIQSERTFVSRIEPSLRPSENHEMTLMFDSFDATKNEIVITIENTNDTNSVNNIIRIPISGSINTTNDTTYSGNRADLEVKIISVGIIDRYNNFYATNNLDTNDTIAVKFQVQNIGGSTSGYYDMKVKVPTEDNSDTKTFRSLSPLAPGVKTEFTVNFENPDSGRNTISIELDPDNDIRENKETNNKDSKTVNIDN